MTKKKISKLLNNKIFWAVISLIASLFIWVYMTGTQEEVISRDLNGVEVVFTGEDTLQSQRGLVITDVSDLTVDVTISGTRLNIGRLTADDVIANLKGHEEEYDALVFACGDAVPVFAQHAGEPWNRDLMEVLKTFGETGKPMIGHCAAGMMFGFAGVAAGRRVAVHPMAKAAVTGPVATDAPFEIDGNFFTAQEEHAIPAMIGRVVEALK